MFVYYKDLEVLKGNGSGKSKEVFGSGLPLSLGNSLWIMIMILIIVAFSYVVPAELEDFDTNVAPVQPGGGVTSPVKCPLELEESESVNNVDYLCALFASFSVIVVSELGDKTFIIVAIMGMSHSRSTVFAGALGALSLMTFICALFGYTTFILPKTIIYLVSTVYFAISGLKMLYDGYRMSPDEGQQKLEEVQNTLRRRDDDNNDVENQASKESPLVSEGYRLHTGLRRVLFTLFSPIFVQAFMMTFLAECGDRSQIATVVILAAQEDMSGVCLGVTLAHVCCIGIAVLGGRVLASRVSVGKVRMIGGVLFLIIAVTSIFLSPEFNMVLSDVEADNNYPYDDPDFERKMELAYDAISKCDTKNKPCPFKN
ncbi:unnamed protein product [Orchesella dallaii]|uniref:GDT1 family protein n=1 Tax=Orchesella dallaii TaxID=48710 RepID=A0ABP1R512_9HEXA